MQDPYEGLTKNAAILKFIGEQSKPPTKTQVINEMVEYGVCSMKLVLDAINKDLVPNEEIVVLKDKKNSQIHHLKINPKNESIKVYNELSKIGKLIEIMEQPLKKNPFDDKIRSLKLAYSLCIPNLLQALLIYTSKNILNETSKSEIYSRLIKLMELFIRQFDIIESPIDFMNIEMRIEGLDSSTIYGKQKQKLKELWDSFKQDILKNEWQRYEESTRFD